MLLVNAGQIFFEVGTVYTTINYSTLILYVIYSRTYYIIMYHVIRIIQYYVNVVLICFIFYIILLLQLYINKDKFSFN